MSKGVKKIKFVPFPNGANNSNSKFGPDAWVRVPANKQAHFHIKEWHKDTTEAQKKDKLYWMVMDKDRKKIVDRIQCMTNKYFGYTIPKHLCGYPYYIEASMSGKPDVNFTGLYLVGICPALITSSAWSRTRGGVNIKNTDDKNQGLCYGDEVHFHASTEGINGDILIVEVYNEMWNGNYKMRTLYNAEVKDGQINIKISNTSEWKASIKQIQDNEEFYVKIKTQKGVYLKDKNGKTEHGKYLNIKNQVRAVNKTKPSNQVPLIVGESETNYARVALCMFSKITIKDEVNFVIFDEGKTSLNRSYSRNQEQGLSVFFDLDKFNIRGDAQKSLKELASSLMVNKHSTIVIDGHADERGPGDYNLRLSQNRSESVMNFLKNNGLSKSRFQCHGNGENQLIYKGAKLTEAQHQKNRRAAIRYNFSEENIPPLKFIVIAPSESARIKKKLNIDVSDFSQKGCFGGDNKHINRIIATNNKRRSTQYSSSFDYEVSSNLSTFSVLPLQYIWPASSVPAIHNFNIHSCKYYSNKKNPTLQIKVYPDIKWRFAFFVNLSNAASIKWQKVSAEKHNELRRKALKLAHEEKGKYTEVDFGVELKASFDKQKDGSYQSNPELTAKYTDKISKLFSTISSIKKIAQGITGGTKGKVSKISKGNLPFDISLNFPAVYVGAEWEADVSEKHNEIGTKLWFFIEAKPLIELKLCIDLLGFAVQAGVAVVSAGSANALALQIFNMVRDWAEKGYETEKAELKFRMYIDLEITGKVDGKAEVNYSTVKNGKEMNFNLTSNITVELKAGLNLKGRVVVIGTTKQLSPDAEIRVEGNLSASASMGITSGHKLQYDSTKGIYYKPDLMIDPCIGKVILLISAGFTYKKISADWKPVNYNESRVFFQGFDIIENLSKITGCENKMLLWEKKK